MISVIFVQTSLWLGKFIFSSNEAVRHDFLWVLAAFLWFCKQEIRHGLLNSPSIEGSLAIILAFCLICYYLMISHQHDPGSPSYQEGKSIEKELPSYPKALRPLIFPCRTSHTRIFPQRHSFSYSYFFVGIPVCCQDPVGSLFPVNPNEIGSNHGRANGAETVVTGFDVDAVDYLNRGDHHQGLNGKLIDFLKAQVKTWCKLGLRMLKFEHRMKTPRSIIKPILLPRLDFSVIHSILRLFGICTTGKKSYTL